MWDTTDYTIKVTSSLSNSSRNSIIVAELYVKKFEFEEYCSAGTETDLPSNHHSHLETIESSGLTSHHMYTGNNNTRADYKELIMIQATQDSIR